MPQPEPSHHVYLGWIDNAWRTAVVCKGRKWAYAVCIGAPIVRHKIPLSDVTRTWRPSGYPLRKAARYLLKARSRLGITRTAAALLRAALSPPPHHCTALIPTKEEAGGSRERAEAKRTERTEREFTLVTSATPPQPPKERAMAPITRTPWPEAQRLDFLPRFAAPHYLRYEQAVYHFMSRACEAYHGGYWLFYTLSNAGFYMALSSDERFELCWPDNWFEGEMSADAASIGVNLFALNCLTFTSESSCYHDAYYALRAYAGEHAEAPAIFRFID